MPQRQEYHHNTPEQIEGYLRMAVEAVEAVNPPAELRETAFAKAVDLFAAKQVILQPIQPLPDLAIPQH